MKSPIRLLGLSLKTASFAVAAFMANLSAPLNAAPAITSVAITPTQPTNADAVTVTANVHPSAGTTLSQVQLTYNAGGGATGTVFRETMNANQTATSWNGSGALNPWTVTAVRAAGDIRQRFGNPNHTPPILLTNCTTNGTTLITCTSTAALWPGMSVNGTSISVGSTIASITNATTFVLSTPATGSGTGLSLAAAGVTLTNCITTTGSPNVSCASTAGLLAGMTLTGTGVAPNPGVLSITDGNNFVLNANVTNGATGLTLMGAGCGLEFSNGTVNYSDTMAATTNAINLGSATAGYVEFYVRTSDFVSNNGWTMQIFPDGGTTWNTRAGENFATTTTINHGFILKHYDLVAADMTRNTKLRFQFSGYVPTPPVRIPLFDIDDVIVGITAIAAPVTVAMFDDGAHGDGLAGDGVFGAVIPALPSGTAVTYSIFATDSLGGQTSSSSATYTVVLAAPSLTVTPATALSTSGNMSGPFSPASATYTLTNTGTGPLSWTASHVAP